MEAATLFPTPRRLHRFLPLVRTFLATPQQLPRPSPHVRSNLSPPPLSLQSPLCHLPAPSP
eukprot:3080987-Pleurochrysis_carterae.AAC.1